MQNVGELIWGAAYPVQMVASAAVAELIRRRVRASRLPTPTVALHGQAERV